MPQAKWEATIERVGVVVGCIVKRDGTYLMVQENQPSAHGLWNLPAGHVDKGEELEAAAVREVKEETGYTVKLLGEAYLYHETASQSVKHVYEGEVIGGELRPQEGEIMDVKWLTYPEIVQLQKENKIRAPWVWESIQSDYSGA